MLKKFTKGAGAGANCDHFKLQVRTPVHANLNLDVRTACVRPKKRSQLTPNDCFVQGQNHKWTPYGPYSLHAFEYLPISAN